VSSDNDEEIIGNVMNKPIDFNRLPKISMEARDALMNMLERDPNKRISADDLLQHSWIKVRTNMSLECIARDCWLHMCFPLIA
jgi:serine/threonine protein kinase